MPGKLTKTKKIREAHREHAKKVLAAVDEALSEFDGSVVAKDQVTRIIITLNDKLATLKSLDESILAAVEEPNIVTEVEESEEFRAQIHAALVKLQRCQTSENESTVPLQSNPGVSTQTVNEVTEIENQEVYWRCERMAVLLGLVQFSRAHKQSAQECRHIELLEELA